MACHQGRKEIVQYLLGKGADKDIKVCFSGFVQLSTVLCKFDQLRPCSGEIFPKFRLKTVDISIIFIILLIIIIFVVVIIIIIIIIAMNRPCTILVILHFL